MFELLLTLLLIGLGICLFVFFLGLMVKLTLLLIGGAIGVISGLVLLAVMVPLLLLFGIVILPLIGLFSFPVLVVALVIWLLVRDNRRNAAFRSGTPSSQWW